MLEQNAKLEKGQLAVRPCVTMRQHPGYFLPQLRSEQADFGSGRMQAVRISHVLQLHIQSVLHQSTFRPPVQNAHEQQLPADQVRQSSLLDLLHHLHFPLPSRLHICQPSRVRLGQLQG